MRSWIDSASWLRRSAAPVKRSSPSAIRWITSLTSFRVSTTWSEAVRCSWVAREISRAAVAVSARRCGAARSTPGWHGSGRAPRWPPWSPPPSHHHRPDRRRKLVEQRPHRLHRFARPLGQAPHLLGDHRESMSVLAGRGGLDGRVEGEDVGFLGDLGDQVENSVDLPRAAAERVGTVGDPGDATLDGLDAQRRGLDRCADVPGRLGPRRQLGL